MNVETTREIALRYRLRSLTLYVATGDGSCPFACDYCFLHKDGQRRDMTIQVLRDAIDFLRRFAITHGPERLHFFGTEPLMRWDLLEEAARYAPDLAISLTTNGYLLTEERIRWLADHHAKVYVYSIDGGPEHHKYRHTRDGKDTWDRVAANLVKLLPTQSGWLTARGTWRPDDYDLVGRYKALEALGAKSIQIAPDTSQPWDEAKVAEAYMALAEHYHGGPSPSRWINDALGRLEAGDIRNRGNTCNAGRYSWTVLPDGTLTLCHGGIELPEWKIGSIYDGVTNESAFLITQRIDGWNRDLPECADCHAKAFCMGIGFCPSDHIIYGTGDVNRPPSGYCAHLRGFITGMKYWLSLRQKAKITLLLTGGRNGETKDRLGDSNKQAGDFGIRVLQR